MAVAKKKTTVKVKKDIVRDAIKKTVVKRKPKIVKETLEERVALLVMLRNGERSTDAHSVDSLSWGECGDRTIIAYAVI